MGFMCVNFILFVLKWHKFFDVCAEVGGIANTMERADFFQLKNIGWVTYTKDLAVVAFSFKTQFCSGQCLSLSYASFSCTEEMVVK